MKAKVFFIVFLLSILSAEAQSPPPSGPRERSFRSELRSNNQKRRQHREKRKQERAERKAVKKHHKRIQTKQVRKRMKSSKKTAFRNNENKKEFFAKRWLKKRSKPKNKSPKKPETN